jgi:LPS sulfotransferase NodH
VCERDVADQQDGGDLDILATHWRVDATSNYADWVLNPPLPERPTRPSRSYFICGTARSGSWMLCGLLASTGVAGRPHEWFYVETEDANKEAWGVSSFSDYLRRVLDAGTTTNGVFGSKLMWAYAEGLFTRLQELGGGGSDLMALEGHFPDPRFIWLQRRDVDAQAVSFEKAIQTGHYHLWNASDSAPAPSYDDAKIAGLVREVTAHNAAWRSWFAANEIEPLYVWFEDLVADPVGVTRSVLEHLGVASEGVPIRELTVSVRDRVNDEWLDSYRQRGD